MRAFFSWAVFALAEIVSSAPVAVPELEKAVAGAAPGTIIEVENGIWRDQVLDLMGRGTVEAPIVIQAAVPGGVVFSGKSAIRLSGAHLVLDGFFFRDGEAPEKTVIALEGEHLRLTNVVIDSYNPGDPESREDKWVTLRGQYHRVDHCTFRNKTSRSVTLTVWRDDDTADHHLIEANHFHTRPPGGKGNGYETLRIGTSDHSKSDSLTTVKGNLFEACDGEMEIVSVKAGRCLIEGNNFRRCAGTLTLRHGDGSRVSANLFAGLGKKGSGGLRVYGADHLITGNVFVGLAGRGGAALALQSGQENPELNGYRRAENLHIEGNLFAANEGPAIRLDTEYGNDRRVQLPRLLVVRSNTFSGSDVEGMVDGADRGGFELRWENNRVFAGNQIPSEITSKFSPPLNKENVGAPWYRDQLP